MRTLAFSLAFSIVLVVISTAIQAGEVVHSHVHHDDGHFFIELQMRIDAPLDRVYTALTDFSNLNNVNHNIIESTVLNNDTEETHIRVVTEGCALFFCRRMTQLQKVRELGQGYILVLVVPEESDFNFGKMLWHIRSEDEQTLINFRADLAPDFWVPPLIGPMILKTMFLEETRQTVNGLETLANHQQTE